MTLVERDQKSVWHPITQHKTHPRALPIKRAEGVYLYDEEGRAYIDAISSWYSAVYGHCHPHVVRRMSEQLACLDHVVFAGLTHEPAIALSEKLLSLLPNNQSKIFFSDNGSTAVEVALKMALQYHHNKVRKRRLLVALEEGFHGDTFGAMSVSGLSVYNGAFESFFLETIRIPAPTGKNNQLVYNQLEQILSRGDVAAFIYEPLVQAAAAMKFNDPEGLSRIIQLCRQHGVITIADEVFTGFGKTGGYFASEKIAAQPDILCLSKALTAGMLPMGATSCSEDIFKAFYSDDRAKGFFHGHTYTANPICCAAALAGIELLESKEVQASKSQMTTLYARFAAQLSSNPKASNIRYMGNIFAFDVNKPMERYGQERDKMFDYFLKRNIFLRPLGNTVFITPPYIISEEALCRLFDAMEGVLETL